MNSFRDVEALAGPWRLAARASLSPTLLGLYTSIRAIPVVGRTARKLAATLVPPGHRVWARVRTGLASGLWLNVDPRFEIGYVREVYEPVLQRVLPSLLRPGATFYDIGAHIGFFSLIAARLVGASGRVFAFEADPQNGRHLAQNAERNGLDQISLLPVGVWSEPGTVSFRRAGDSSSRNTGSVAASAEKRGPGEVVQIKAVTLDQFVGDHPTPSLIKIDVEGAEVDVLRGAQRLLRTGKPRLICEVHQQEALSFLEAFLPQEGYSLEWLEPEPNFPCHLLAQPW